MLPRRSLHIGNYSLCHGLAGNAEILAGGRPLLGGESENLVHGIALTGIQAYSQPGHHWPGGVPGGSAGGLPGRYQVGWGEGGVYMRGGCSGAGDSDERDRVGGDPVPVTLERYEVVGVELARLQPLD